MDNIEKLKEKVDKDPTSRLFVPLAEEYRKAGMLDEAVEVLMIGIENQPTYVSARAALGKIYVEKGMLDEARREFEQVIEAIPDNLFAQRKLADIYREKGLRTEAIEQYRRTLKLNPMDEEAQRILQELESPLQQVPEDAVPAEEAVEVEAALEDEDFLLGISEGDEAHLEAEVAEPLEVGEEDTHIAVAEPVGEEDAEEALEVVDAEAVEDVGEEVAEVIAEAGAEAAATSLSTEEEAVKQEVQDALAAFGMGDEELGAAAFGDIGEATAEEEMRASDDLIKKEDYAGALKRLRAALSREPENADLLQRLQELQTLLKLIGKEGELTIAKMESFLDTIKKRKDELHGNA